MGPYVLVKPLGAGTSAAVWLATEEGRPIALKILHPHVRDNAHVVARLAAEGRVLQQLDHPGLARVRAFGVLDEHVYIAMDHVPGRALAAEMAAHVAEGRVVPWPRVRAWAVQIGDALDHAHGHGIIHRDLKPQNLLVSGDAIVIVDFGIARVLDGDALDATTLGRRLGTTAYMSPEQALGQPVTVASDVFALATVLFEVLTLHRAWLLDSTGAALPWSRSAADGANGPQPLMSRIAGGPRPVASAYRPDLGAAVDAVFASSLAVDPGSRHSSASGLVQALLGALGAFCDAAPASAMTGPLLDRPLSSGGSASGAQTATFMGPSGSGPAAAKPGGVSSGAQTATVMGPSGSGPDVATSGASSSGARTATFVRPSSSGREAATSLAPRVLQPGASAAARAADRAGPEEAPRAAVDSAATGVAVLSSAGGGSTRRWRIGALLSGSVAVALVWFAVGRGASDEVAAVPPGPTNFVATPKARVVTPSGKAAVPRVDPVPATAESATEAPWDPRHVNRRSPPEPREPEHATSVDVATDRPTPDGDAGTPASSISVADLREEFAAVRANPAAPGGMSRLVAKVAARAEALPAARGVRVRRLLKSAELTGDLRAVERAIDWLAK